MSNHDKIKIFSSHRWAYDNHRQGLHDLLQPWVKNVDFVDFSIPRAHPVAVEDDLELATEIRDRIRHCDVFLVFAGMYVNQSDWVKFEIHSAFNDSCPILAVVPNGQERLAKTATKFANRRAYWRSESIRTAIWQLLPISRKQEILQAQRARSAPISSFPPQRHPSPFMPPRSSVSPFVPPALPTQSPGLFDAFVELKHENYLADLLGSPPSPTPSVFDFLLAPPKRK